MPTALKGVLPVAPKPAENIEARLKSVLASDLNFKGEFAFGRAFPDAPNPCLDLDDVGLVGLPLSPAMARSVIAQCIQAPFGKGERTIVDKEVRDTWEMDATKVKFCNPAWGPFVERVVREVCTTLGVNFDASKPRAELYKLLVYETGSHFLPHVDTEKANGMFASIIVVLPSHFTGGDAHTSHSNTKSVYNSSNNSMTSTTVLAWYTDVTHEIKPITSGYRFALTYNLVHTTTAIRPALSSADGAISKLRHVFQSWNANKNGPKKIFYLLEHHYSQANLSASALKSSDAHVMGILDKLAKEVGFGLGLANLQVTQSGPGDDEGYNEWGRNRYGYDDEEEDEDDDEEVGFLEITDTETTVENFVDPDGKPIDGELDIDDSLQQELEDRGDYEQDYEGYMGNGAGSLERFYRSSVLVIWPRWSHIGGASGDRRAVGALERLETLNGDTPTPEELVDFKYLCSVVKDMADEDQSTAVERLFGAAILWQDAALWTEAVAQCCAPDMSLDAVTEDDLHDARATFGFSVTAQSLRPVILNNNSNERLQFVQNLQALKETDTDRDAEEIASFVQEMRKEVLDNMRPYLSAAELQSFSKEVLAEGGAQMLRDRLVPQIQKHTTKNNVATFEQYIDWLHGEWTTSTTPVSEDESSKRAALMTTLLELLLPMKVLFATKKGVTHDPRTAYPYYGTQTPTAQGDAGPAIALISKCLNYGNPQLAASLVEKIAKGAISRVAAAAIAKPSAPNIAGPGTGDALQKWQQSQARVAIVPAVVFALVPVVKALFQSQTPPIDVGAQLAQMAQTAVNIKLQALRTRGNVAVERNELASLLDVTKGLDNSDALLTIIIATLKALPWNEQNWVACMEEFSARRQSNEATFGPHVLEMSNIYAQKVTLPAPYGHYGGYSVGSIAPYTKAFQLSYTTGGLAALTRVITRTLQPTSLNEVYVTSLLVPLIPELKALATTNNLSLASPPFSQALQGIVAAWMAKILGQKPNLNRVKEFSEKVKRVTCKCTHCTQVVRFLQSSDQQTMQLSRIGAPSVKHVSRELAGKLNGDVKYDVVRSSPQGLTVTKTPELARAAKWGGLLTQGRTLLRSIGSEAELKNIWGDKYVAALGPLLPKEQRVLAPASHPGPPLTMTQRQRVSAPNNMPNRPTFDLPPLPQIQQESIRKQVFTHKGYFARPVVGFEDKADDLSPDNEKFEFLGDAVLELAVTSLLAEMYPGLRKLRSMIVENAHLAPISVKYGLPQHLLADRTQALALRNTVSVQADLFEAFVGGLYTDQGMNIVQPWLHALFRPYARNAYNTIRAQHGQPPLEASPSDSSGFGEPSGHIVLFNQTLQKLSRQNVEWRFLGGEPALQAMPVSVAPEDAQMRAALDAYREAHALGNKVTPVWSAQVTVDGELYGRGIGNTKRAAKNEAAKQGLRILGVTV
ncbi:hypothetical protein C8F01DRAFT_1247277 [Mycena amicta]|nr:hypothetical protein C8F01DRAFT_1247277 [Mycena amicta]